MRLRRRVHFNFDAATNVRYDAFDGIPQDFSAFALEILVLLTPSILAFPNVVRFASGCVHVNDVLTFGCDFRIEHGGNEDCDDVLGITERSVPVQNAQMRRIQIG